MRILVTGHNGYIGSVLTPMLAAEGFEVVGYDLGYYRDCSLIPDSFAGPEIRKDLRDVTPADLDGVEAVIHLAALSNDPVGDLNQDWTEAINYRASVQLAEAARAAGVSRFIFSSSCIMYGLSTVATVTEEAPLAPQTGYARSKVNSERAIRALADERFSPIFLRNGTVYGLSPRMRFDTVLNNLTGAAVTTGRVVLYSDGQPWRPVVHVQDVARSFIHVLRAPREHIHNQAFNNGAAHLNHQVLELAQLVVDAVPHCQLEIRAEAGADQRTYKTDFSKFARTFPDFEFKWNARAGARELIAAFQACGLTLQDFQDPRFTRVRWLRQLLTQGRLNADLRWQA